MLKKIPNQLNKSLVNPPQEPMQKISCENCGRRIHKTSECFAHVGEKGKRKSENVSGFAFLLNQCHKLKLRK